MGWRGHPLAIAQGGLVEVDSLPRHWKQQGLDWGWVIVIWLAYIVSQGDHRKVVVREWVEQRRRMLEEVCGIEIRATDFSDDRLSIVLRQLSEEERWSRIEKELNQQTVRIYRLTPEVVRLDATTLSGNHIVNEAGLFQFGHSKDDPSKRPSQVNDGEFRPARDADCDTGCFWGTSGRWIVYSDF